MVKTWRIRSDQFGLCGIDQKNPNQPSIEIIYQDLNNVKSLPFPGKEERDRAFKAILENLSRMKLYFE